MRITVPVESGSRRDAERFGYEWRDCGAMNGSRMSVGTSGERRMGGGAAGNTSGFLFAARTVGRILTVVAIQLHHLAPFVHLRPLASDVEFTGSHLSGNLWRFASISEGEVMEVIVREQRDAESESKPSALGAGSADRAGIGASLSHHQTKRRRLKASVRQTECL
ncbi:hypothetical protein B0H13DRAFT_1853425 [Mycena leptocephala]|nr:hypothetical protein B0H13DRAFT_1853425 [Mycena leptocephala]